MSAPATIPQAQIDAAMSMLAHYGVPEDKARIALFAAYSAGRVDVPDGWQIVPKRETAAMLAAAQSAWLADPLRRTSTLWVAMLSAAPTPPTHPASPRTR